MRGNEHPAKFEAMEALFVICAGQLEMLRCMQWMFLMKSLHRVRAVVDHVDLLPCLASLYLSPHHFFLLLTLFDVFSTMPTDSVAYYNGKVCTLDDSSQIAEAFIVSPDGTFLAVGTTTDILSTAKANGNVTYNLNGRFIMPGIHDAHVHLLSAGVSYLSGVSLPADTTAANLGQRLQDGQCTCAYQHAFQDWVVGNIFTIPDFDRAALDSHFPDTPVVIQGGAGHSAFVNTAGLLQAGYAVDNEPDVKGAKFRRRPDGSLTGELGELAMNKAMLAKGNPNLAHAKRAIKAAIRVLHQAGVTSCQEAATNSVILDALRELDIEENALEIDIAAHSVYAPEFLANERLSSLKELIDRAPGLATKHVRTNFVKILLDGVPLPPLFSSAGLDSEGNIEHDKILVDDVVEAVKRFDERGLTVKIHATGQGSTRLALDAINTARKSNVDQSRGIIKHEIAHCNGIHPGKSRVTYKSPHNYTYLHILDTYSSRRLGSLHIPKRNR
jgi:predicted amidohydrolase YtcJ